MEKILISASDIIVDRSSLMTGTKFGQGTRGFIKIRNGYFTGDTDTAEIFFAKQAKRVRHVIHENLSYKTD
jgi:hypothetical protein